MRAIALSVVCAACLAPLPGVAAEDAPAAAAVVFTMSESLSNASAARFLAQTDRRRLTDYGALERNVVALVAQYEISSSVEVLEQAEREGGFDLVIDWLLHLTPASAPGPADRRQSRLRCRIERIEGKWKVTALAPVDFFSALRPR